MTSSPATLAASTQARDAAKPVFGWLFAAAIVAVITAYVRAVAFTPIEALQGAVQKIYYLHVPAWMACYLAYGLVALGSVINLWLHDERADRLAASAAEVGILFNTVGLTVGPLWAKPIWGTWWTWDARLTSTLFLWFIFAAYLVLRGAIESPSQRARFSAVLAVLGVLLIPFIHLSVYLFRTLHPMPIMLQPQALVNPPLSPEMETTFVIASLAFVLLCVALVVARYRVATLTALADEAEGIGE